MLAARPAAGRFERPIFPPIVGAALVVSVLGSLLVGSLAIDWAVGAFAGLFVLVRGRAIERVLLVVLVALCVIAGGAQMTLGLRGVLFIMMFVMVARYVEINPWFHLVVQLVALAIASLFTAGSILEIFVFGPSVLFLILSDHMIRYPARNGKFRSGFVAILFNILGFTATILGNGSRSALFIWLAFNTRRLKLKYFLILGAVVLLSIPALLALKDLPVFQKLNNSITELAEPIDPETGGVSQRAYENILFLNYITNASVREIMLGSTITILLDGEPLGQEHDVQFIPHNQIFGMFFQFGVVGCLIFIYFLGGLLRYFFADPFCGFMMLMLLLPGFVLKGGVFDSNLALLAATLNWVRSRHLERQVAH